MTKVELRQKACELRTSGKSISDISNQLGISKGTASLWVRGIVLNEIQQLSLKKKSLDGAARGRFASAISYKNKREDRTIQMNNEGVALFQGLSDREILIAGLSLYWAEGSKKTRVTQFCNSDPKLIVFMIHWLQKCFRVQKDQLAVKVGVNFIHKEREEDIKEYWSKVTGIPLSQFRKTSFKFSKSRKTYDNFEEHFGTFDVKVLKSVELYYKILGLIHGLSRQGSSAG